MEQNTELKTSGEILYNKVCTNCILDHSHENTSIKIGARGKI